MKTINLKKGDKVDFVCAGVPSTGFIVDVDGKECRVSSGVSVVSVYIDDVVVHKEEADDSNDKIGVKSQKGSDNPA